MNRPYTSERTHRRLTRISEGKPQGVSYARRDVTKINNLTPLTVERIEDRRGNTVIVERRTWQGLGPSDE